MSWRSYTSDELERQYNPRLAVPDYEAFLSRYASRSAETRERVPCRLDLRYGASAGETLDVFPAASATAPVHVFIHGGYWRTLDKSDFSFVGGMLAAAGATGVVVNYDLCPAVTVGDIVGQVLRALAWVYRHGAELGGDPNRLYVSGHSVGAHLVAMALAHDWSGRDGLPVDMVKGGCAISGVYDIEPITHTSIQDDVHLTPEEIERFSPMRAPPKSGGPLIVAYGGDEGKEWHRQSREFADQCRGQGIACELLELEGEHHFSIMDQLADPARRLSRAMIAQMSL